MVVPFERARLNHQKALSQASMMGVAWRPDRTVNCVGVEFGHLELWRNLIVWGCCSLVARAVDPEFHLIWRKSLQVEFLFRKGIEMADQ
eukprot:1289682-Amphidinium_carterae.2